MEEVDKLSSLKDEQINEAKKIAAFEITKLIHGEEEAKKAQESTEALFGGNGVPSDIPTTKVDNTSISILDALVLSNLAPSKGQARILISQGGITLNGSKIEDVNYILSESDFSDGSAILKKGKKTYHKLEK